MKTGTVVSGKSGRSVEAKHLSGPTAGKGGMKQTNDESNSVAAAAKKQLDKIRMEKVEKGSKSLQTSKVIQEPTKSLRAGKVLHKVHQLNKS